MLGLVHENGMIPQSTGLAGSIGWNSSSWNYSFVGYPCIDILEDKAHINYKYRMLISDNILCREAGRVI